MKPMTRCMAAIVLVQLASCREVASRYVIIHADDAGMCESVNRATIRAMETGLVSSASIMVPCPAFEKFAAYAVAHPEKDFGIHLVLNSEWDEYRWGPVSSQDRVPSLVDEDGYLWKTGPLVGENVKVEEAEIELRAQIERAKDRGIRISHLDSHMFSLATRPDLFKLYVKLGLDYDLPILMPRAVDARQMERNADLAQLQPLAMRELESHGLPMIDFVNSNSYGVKASRKREHYLRLVRQMMPGITQIVIHCGMDDAELARITSSAARRYADFCVFTSAEMAEELRMMDVQITNWRELRRLTENPTAARTPRLPRTVAKAVKSPPISTIHYHD